MMREASITLPLFDNDGHALDSAHAMLRNELLQAFGGLSAMPVQGMWRDETGRTFTDDGMRYAVAMRNPNAYRSTKKSKVFWTKRVAAYVADTGGRAREYWDLWCQDVATAYKRTADAISRRYT